MANKYEEGTLAKDANGNVTAVYQNGKWGYGDTMRNYLASNGLDATGKSTATNTGSGSGSGGSSSSGGTASPSTGVNTSTSPTTGYTTIKRQDGSDSSIKISDNSYLSDEAMSIINQMYQNGANWQAGNGTHTSNKELAEELKALGYDASFSGGYWSISGGAEAPQQKTEQQQQQQMNTYNPYTDTAYMEAIAALQNVSKATPTYANSYEAQLKDLYNQIVNKDKFSYDINSDMLYKQYAEQYANNGRLAMQDTLGQAASLTGGYDSSYAQNVGQQSYNQYMQGLNDVIPELYDKAYGQYMDEYNQMLQQYSLLGDMADDEYAKYSDAYNRWLTERDYALNRADTAYNRGYAQWAAGVDQANADRNYALNEASVTGYYNGQATQDKVNADRNYALNEASVTGYYNGQATQDKVNADRNYGLNVAEYQQKLKEAEDEKQLATAKLEAAAGNYAKIAAYYGVDEDTYKKANGISDTVATPGYYVPPKVDDKSDTAGTAQPYTLTELSDAAAAGMTKAQIETVLKARGVNVTANQVQSDIKWALSR